MGKWIHQLAQRSTESEAQSKSQPKSRLLLDFLAEGHSASRLCATVCSLVEGHSVFDFTIITEELGRGTVGALGRRVYLARCKFIKFRWVGEHTGLAA